VALTPTLGKNIDPLSIFVTTTVTGGVADSMSGWTILTLRGLYSRDYEQAKYNERDPYKANCDLVVSLDNDDRVHEVGYWNGHVYATLSTERYDWETTTSLLDDAQAMIYDAVVIGANDTTDTGTAKYYPVHDSWNGDVDDATDHYEETQSEDGTLVGAMAASVMTARHGIVAQERLRYRGKGNWDNGITDHQRERGEDKL